MGDGRPRPEPGPPPEESARPAGFRVRAAALLIDGIVLSPLAAAAYAFYTAAGPTAAALLSVPAVLYKPLLEWRYGATLGKMACGVRVVDRRGGRPGLGVAYLRFSPWLAQSLVGIVTMAGVLSAPQPRMVSGFLGLGLVVQWGPTDVLGVVLNGVILIDCAAAAFTTRKRALHDLLAGTCCVRRAAGPSAAPDRGGMS